MKVEPVKFQEDNLHRHADFAPKVKPETAVVKREPHQTPVRGNSILRTRTDHLGASISGEFDDEFDGNLFDGVDISESQGEEFSFESAAPGGIHGATPSKPAPVPNAVSRQMVQRAQHIPTAKVPNGAQQSHAHNVQNNPARPIIGPPNPRPPQTPIQQNTNSRPIANPPRMPPPTADMHVAPKLPNQNQNQGTAQQNASLRPTPPQAQQLQQSRPPPQAISISTSNPPANHRPPVGFVTSRAAELLQNDQIPTSLATIPAFNPNVESPIPKAQRTPGLDHAASRPIKRQEVGAPTHPLPPPNIGPSAGTGAGAGAGGGFTRPGPGPRASANFVNPHQDANRRIGMPGAAISPMNRGGYKPPTKRPALQDVSNQAQNQGGTGGGEPEAKRQKVDGGASGVENAKGGAVGSV